MAGKRPVEGLSGSWLLRRFGPLPSRPHSARPTGIRIAATALQDHGNAPNSTSPPAASRVAPSTQAALAVPISPSASPRSAAPPTTTAQAQPAVIDAASEGDDAWGDEWAAAGNGTWNGTDAADADGSEGEQPEGADWGVLYLVIIIIVATVAGVGALVSPGPALALARGAIPLRRRPSRPHTALPPRVL